MITDAILSKTIGEITEAAKNGNLERRINISQQELCLMQRYLDWWDNAGWKRRKEGDIVICEDSIDMALLRQIKPMFMGIIAKAQKGEIVLND